VGRGSRGDVTVLPTLVINNVQYRGKLERTSVLKAVCAGFKETTDPPICLNGAVGPARCTMNNGGCWSENVGECKEGLACQWDGCTCSNRWGSYDYKCKGDLLYIMEQDTCIVPTYIDVDEE
ncbi:hypothetical protein IFM89_000292, partial [Coptis chinensis]